MTCIVGIVDDGKVFIGGDSASASGWMVRRTALSKVFRLNGFLIGYTSSFRMGQLLQYMLNVPPQKVAVDDMAYMVTVFAEAVRECLKEGGYTKVDNNREEAGTFLVGYKGHLYEICADLQVNEAVDGFDAVGCGCEYALGALMVTRNVESNVRVAMALEAAAWFSGTVVEPFNILELT